MSSVGLTDAVAERAGTLAVEPSALGRNITGFACALIVYLSVRGLIFTHAPLIQLAGFVGATAGLFAFTIESAGIGAALAMAVGWVLLPPEVGTAFAPEQLMRADIVELALLIFGSAAVAMTVRWSSSVGTGRVPAALVWVMVALLAVNLVASANAQFPLLQQRLEQRPVAGTPWADEDAYLEMHRRMLEGSTYHEAVLSVWQDNTLWDRAPDGVFDIRPFGLFMFYELISRDCASLPHRLLIIYVVALFAAAGLVDALMRRRFAIVGAACVAPALLYIVTSTHLMLAEAWAMPFAIIAVAALVYAAEHPNWRWAFLLGVVAACFAAAFREFYLCLFPAGLAAAYVAQSGRRHFQKLIWMLATGAIGTYYLIHIAMAARVVGGTGPMTDWFHPSILNIIMAMGFLKDAFGAVWIDAFFVLVGAVGVYLAPKGQVRILLGGVVLTLALFFLMFRTQVIDIVSGQVYDYWGIALSPFLYTCVPLVFALVPGMRRPEPAPE